MNTITRRALVSAGAATALAPGAFAQAFPSKPMRLLVPYPVGGIVDIVARAVTEPMQAELGQPIVVENKPGASGTIGFNELVRAPADGYTLAMGVANIITNPILLPKTTKWKTTDFVGIGQIGAPPNVIVTAANHPARTLREFVEQMHANPEKFSVANPGVGTSNHLGQELFLQKVGLQIQSVMYKGQPEIIPDVASGQVTFSVMTVALAATQVQKGTLKALAVVSPKRLPQLPEVPTITEAGYSDATYMPTYGIIGLAGTPKDVVAKLSDAMQKALASPEVVTRLEKIGAVIVPANAQEYDRNIAAETGMLSALIRDRNIRLPE